MHQNYIKIDPWSLIEEGFNKEHVKSSESLFSIGNGSIGQRANFEEHYSGDTFQGSYVGGIYYPDKTKVGWWKNGYPEYFAKVLNAPNWIGIDVYINGIQLDLNTCKAVEGFRRKLCMKEGWLKRQFIATLQDDTKVAIESMRFLSLKDTELGVIHYSIIPMDSDAEVKVCPYIDGGILNEDANWEERFWKTLDKNQKDNYASVTSMTYKTEFEVATGMSVHFNKNGKPVDFDATYVETEDAVRFEQTFNLKQGERLTTIKFGAYCTSLNHVKSNLAKACQEKLMALKADDFNTLLETQIKEWAAVWDMADIQINGDDAAQQGIRFNIFQLNQTYSGKDPRLNVGPKGFTGEKYGGSTYWDTEAYCIPFYMATKNHDVAKNLLVYRHNQLDKAIENAMKVGLNSGSALYPMVTMNGEECHNEWEITFEEIHRNGAIAYAIYNYTRYTGDTSYVQEKGIDVLIAIARFWKERANFSKQKNQYVILGVTGPNEYENNVNNNWYTNYQARWCLEYCLEQLEALEAANTDLYQAAIQRNKLTTLERDTMQSVAENMYFPYDEELGLFMQQDNFLDKEIIPAAELPADQRPINQHWSWDKILRSCYIKQADVLQGFYFFKDRFSKEEHEKHFDFYEPLTVHESSLSPCIHSILASYLGRMDKAYEFYLQTSRLDLDDYNKEVEEGCHITSMAGTWSSIVEGFGGMSVKDGKISFEPTIPKQWDSYSFKINFRSNIIELYKSQTETKIKVNSDRALEVYLDGKMTKVEPQEVLTA